MKHIKMIVRCESTDEAEAVEKTLNGGGHNTQHGVGVSIKGNDVILDQREAEKPYKRKTIKRIRKAAKGIRNLRRSLEKHGG